jgi:putative lipoprotein
MFVTATAVLVQAACATIPATAAATTAQTALALENTQWRLVSLADGLEVSTALGRDSPHVLLSSSQERMTGYGGCNRFGGAYGLDSPALTFGPLISTRMLCSSGMETEQALKQALSDTRSWRVVEGRLEFLDSDGVVVALFEAQ